jgi:hypothetical protein
MTAMNTTPFPEAVSDGNLVFDLIALPKVEAVGVTRTLTTEAGAFEQHLVFDHRQQFSTWLDNDDYRHQAQALFVRVYRRFEELLEKAEERDDADAEACD